MPLPDGVRITRLARDYSFKDFDCSDGDLNEFLLKDSKNSMAMLQSVTMIIETDDEIVGFFSLLNDKISIEDFDSRTQWQKWFNQKRPKQKHGYPAMKIGRFAVAKAYQKKSIGQAMLDYLKILFVSNNRTGCRFITVDAYAKSVGFYEKNGFTCLTKADADDDTRVMFFDLQKVV